jgi:enediyne biosynthesis protein E3
VTLSLGQLRMSLMGVSHKKATAFSAGDTRAWQRLETCVLAAIDGYHATLEDSRLAKLVPRLETVDLELRGFAYEGAALGLTGLDCLLPWRNRLQAFLDGPGSAHIYMVHIGMGEALAMLRQRPEPFLARLDPVLRWLVMDGYGFHKGFFSRRRYIEQQAVPSHLSAYARRIFDQGLGRSIWFLVGANIERVAARIAVFPPARQADLWAGIGVACAYAGGAERADIERLRQVAGIYRPQLSLGTAVVAKGRQRAGNPAAHSDLACRILCGMSSDQAAQITDVAFQNLPIGGAEPAFQVLQQRLAAQFAVPDERVSRREVVML